MRFLVGAMFVVFSFGGIFMLTMALREIVQRIGSVGRFDRAEGVVVGVETKRMHVTSSGTWKSTLMHFPIITFSHRDGRSLTFTSEVGDSGQVSRYAKGQKLGVVYDPDGELPPMLDSWFGIWFPNIMFVFAGLMMLLGAFIIYWAFGDRILPGILDPRGNALPRGPAQNGLPNGARPAFSTDGMLYW